MTDISQKPASPLPVEEAPVLAAADKEKPAPAPDVSKRPVSRAEKTQDTEKEPLPSFGNWFLTFLVMDIPVIGFITLLLWAFGPHTDPVKRTFARARLFYRILFAALSVFLLWNVFRLALPQLEKLLDYLQKI
jgi:hypothetical protein